MFGDIANRRWGLSNLWIILKWRSCHRHLLSSPAHSWRRSNLAVKQLLAGKADKQMKHHPSWRTTGEWKHSHQAICTYWLILVLVLTKLKMRSNCLWKWCRELMFASGVYMGRQSRMGSTEGLLLPLAQWGKMECLFIKPRLYGGEYGDFAQIRHPLPMSPSVVWHLILIKCLPNKTSYEHSSKFCHVNIFHNTMYKVLQIHTQWAVREKRSKVRNVLVNAYHRNTKWKTLRKKERQVQLPFNTTWWNMVYAIWPVLHWEQDG